METTSLNAVSYVVTVIGIRDLTWIKQTVSTTVNRRFVSRSIDTDHTGGSDFSGQIFAWNISGESREREREGGKERGGRIFQDYSINLHVRYVVKTRTEIEKSDVSFR